jgi:ribonuclease D
LSDSVAYTNITKRRQLEAFCRRLADCQRIALDTEFVAERSYRPLLCLVQAAADDELVLIDALAVGDLAPFWQAIVRPGLEMIVHAGRVEMEFCLRATDRLPERVVDVQIAAGLIGVEYPAGYSTLISKLLGETPKKHETRTDWRRRPLSERQIRYALDDARHLPAIHERIRGRLEELGRLEWLEQETASWKEEIRHALSEERWRRVSGNAGLDARSLAIVRELWRWREAEAERRDCPVRRVLRDDLIVELARRQTADEKRIHAVRGLERGDLRRSLPKIAGCIRRALSLPEDQCPQPARRESVPQLSVLGQFLFSALGSICRQNDLAPTLVGTPNDIRDLIAYRTGQMDRRQMPALARGWRAAVVGQVFDDLLAGKVAVRIGDPTSEYPLLFDRRS